MIKIKNVSKVYPGKPPIHALKNINLTIEKGTIFGIIGFSGAGKSTLIRCLNRLEEPTEGTIHLNGLDLMALNEKELRKTRRKIGMIFQHFNLLSAKTVFDNIAMPLYLEGKKKKDVEEKVRELTDFVGLTGKENVYPGHLSGGQKQRVGIARALVTDPDILLCDEATSALDPETTKNVLELLRKVNKAYNLTIVLITHEMSVIRDLCDKVAVIDNGEIAEEGSVYEVFTNPQKTITRNFVNTVLQNEVPSNLSKALTNGKFYRLIFLGERAANPLLSEVSKRFDIHLNILYGSITELQDKPYGNLFVALDGSQEESRKAIQYILENGVDVKEVIPHGA
ncbi:methionine ABC transporter ATP-binding protein [Heyndrickxia camelliae]|uniref:Phosphate ABC transporter ATP-binding protein n=1 Tax=Heyndrickxia camelliae TaxID=1707093 RepID=A0A2N3LGK7_9BACI|nr:ATP-binding cassette domain-containing protein [Heyndrickxia camelliae]PKR83746.1 phosphate ABC transporter ATP-binding protein [Heyndrickxia camelliae]